MHSMTIKEVICALERFAPLPLQADYDNAGLQVGLTEVEVSGALLCLDVTPAIIDEAVEKQCNLVVAHHPLIFHKLKRIADENEVQCVVRKAIEQHVVVYAMHTNIDSARGGVNFKIAEKLGLTQTQFFGHQQTVDGVDGGDGIIGEYPTPLAADDFVLQLKRQFDVECVQCNALLRRPIRRVTVCGGAGSFLLEQAWKWGADAFITGEMHYHEYFGYDQKLQIAVIGHYQSEQYTTEIFQTIITEQCCGVRCVQSAINTNPIIYL